MLALSPPRWPNVGKLCSGASAAEASSRVGVPRVEAIQLVQAPGACWRSLVLAPSAHDHSAPFCGERVRALHFTR